MKRTGITASLIVLVVLLVAAVSYTVIVKRNGGSLISSIEKDSGSNISDYSAVFLTNGQVYFGKINGRSDSQIDLRDIYYLQVNQSSQLDQKTTSTTDPQVSLVKLGNELHGPNDRMRINTTQVLFTESLKSDSKVVTAIANFKSK